MVFHHGRRARLLRLSCEFRVGRVRRLGSPATQRPRGGSSPESRRGRLPSSGWTLRNRVGRPRGPTSREGTLSEPAGTQAARYRGRVRADTTGPVSEGSGLVPEEVVNKVFD